MAIDQAAFQKRGGEMPDLVLYDHQAIRRLLAALIAASDWFACLDALTSVRSAIAVHNATDEHLIYPALKALDATTVTYAHFYRYTSQVETLLARLEWILEHGNLAEFSLMSIALQATASAHFAEEESGALAALNEHARSQQLRNLTAAVLVFRVTSHVGLF